MTSPAFSLTDHLRTVHRPGAVARAVARLLGRPTPSVAVDGWFPRNDNIAVLPLAEADRTAGGIVLAETVRERPQKGVVVAIGPGLYDPERERVLPVETAVGDLVVFGKFAGVSFELSNHLHVFIMRNVEFMAARPAGTYDLVEHVVDAGTPRERRTYHEEGMLCEHCPTPALDEERAKHREAIQRSLGEPSTAQVPVAEPPAADPLAATDGDSLPIGVYANQPLRLPAGHSMASPNNDSDLCLQRSQRGSLCTLVDGHHGTRHVAHDGEGDVVEVWESDVTAGAEDDAVVIERVEKLMGRPLSEAETGVLATLLAEMAARRIYAGPDLDVALREFIRHNVPGEFPVTAAFVEAALSYVVGRTDEQRRQKAAPTLAEERAKFQAEQRAALHGEAASLDDDSPL